GFLGHRSMNLSRPVLPTTRLLHLSLCSTDSLSSLMGSTMCAAFATDRAPFDSEQPASWARPNANARPMPQLSVAPLPRCSSALPAAAPGQAPSAARRMHHHSLVRPLPAAGALHRHPS